MIFSNYNKIIFIVITLLFVNFLPKILSPFRNTNLDAPNRKNFKALHITNSRLYHNEIIESLVVNYKNLINDDVDYIYITTQKSVFFYLPYSFEKYIFNKYKNLRFGKPPNDYQKIYTIHVTEYSKTITKNVNFSNKSHYFICHKIDSNLKKNKNVFTLIPLYCRYIIPDILPFQDRKIKKNIPIFIIQGNINKRDTDLLRKILSNSKTNYPYKIKILSKKYPPKDICENKNIVHKIKYTFIKYHQEFLDCYGLIPLISFEKQPHYYTTKCTSSINYAIGYNLKCFVDQIIQNIYNIDNVQIYQDENDIVVKFDKMVFDFYNS